VSQRPVPVESPPPARGRRYWLAAIIVAVAGVFLYLAFRRVNWSELLAAIRHVRVSYLVLWAAITSANYLVRSLRWRVLLSADRRVPLVTVFWANMAGYLGNSFLPARAGELIRSVALGARTGMSKSYVLATALTERVMDVVALVLFGLVASLVMRDQAPRLLSAVRILGVIGLAGVAVVLLAPALERPLRRLVQRLPAPGRLRPKLDEMLVRFLTGMRALQSPGRAAGFGALTILIWLIDGVGTVAGGHAFGMAMTLPQALLLLAGLGLSSAIPSTPGYVGVYQFVAVTLLVPLGFARPSVLAFILVGQALGYVLITVWGILGLWRLGIRLRGGKPLDPAGGHPAR